MRVVIEREHGKYGTGMTGLFKSSAYVVKLGVTLTNEELATIEKAALGDYTLIERPYHKCYGAGDPDQFVRMAMNTLRVSQLKHIHSEGKPRIVYYADDQPQADRADAELREALKMLKTAIDNASVDRPKTDSFEL